MSNLLADRHRKKNLLSQKRHVEFENTFLDMAQMYCCIGNYSQAFDWCLSYLECAQPNEQLSYILEMIFIPRTCCAKMIDSVVFFLAQFFLELALFDSKMS